MKPPRFAYPKDWILKRYHEAADKQRIISILAELNNVDAAAIRALLTENGVTPVEGKRRKKCDERILYCEEHSGRVASGKEAAEALGLTAAQFKNRMRFNCNTIEGNGQRWTRITPRAQRRA